LLEVAPLFFANVNRPTARTVETALISRSEIDMATGALSAIQGGGAEEAFARLVDESQHRNIKLRDVAVELLDRLRTSPER
jgi:AmiR/NasT family two-component response regulator